ncbi:hypothetical protein LXL04_037094 [Taraxacum kok-saghyz]
MRARRKTRQLAGTNHFDLTIGRYSIHQGVAGFRGLIPFQHPLPPRPWWPVAVQGEWNTNRNKEEGGLSWSPAEAKSPAVVEPHTTVVAVVVRRAEATRRRVAAGRDDVQEVRRRWNKSGDQNWSRGKAAGIRLSLAVGSGNSRRRKMTLRRLVGDEVGLDVAGIESWKDETTLRVSDLEMLEQEEAIGIFGIGVNQEAVNNMAIVMGCKANKLPAMFLGIPIGKNMKRIESWKTMEETFKKKMSNWKLKTLSIGGRHTIVSNILGNMGNYWLALFPIPKSTAKKLEALRRNFFWGYTSEEQSINWVNWESVCLKKEFGGLGIIALIDINLALLDKWVWRFKTEQNALWVKVAIGDGRDTGFWNGRWSNEGVFKTKYPRLFALEVEKNIAVADRVDKPLNNWEWRRPIRDGRERSEAIALEQDLKEVSRNASKDRWIIQNAPNECFSTAWLRRCNDMFKTMGRSFINYWSKWMPKKANIFIWRLLKGRIPVSEVLDKMGIDLPSTLCPFCKSDIESAQHLFLKCPWSYELWTRLNLWWGYEVWTNEIETIEEIFLKIDYLPIQKKAKKAMFVIASSVLKGIWECRNKLIFKNERMEVEVEPDVDGFRFSLELV